jgi:hypothetical protein
MVWNRLELTVMAMVGGTAFPENREISAMVCATPAEGPSCGCLSEGVFALEIGKDVPWGLPLMDNERGCCGSS